MAKSTATKKRTKESSKIPGKKGAAKSSRRKRPVSDGSASESSSDEEPKRQAPARKKPRRGSTTKGREQELEIVEEDEDEESQPEVLDREDSEGEKCDEVRRLKGNHYRRLTHCRYRAIWMTDTTMTSQSRCL